MARVLLLGTLLVAAVLAGGVTPLPLQAADESPPTAWRSELAWRLDALVSDSGLSLEHTALQLYSVRNHTNLYSHKAARPMIPASNLKLVTAYAALKALSPDHRWRTRFYAVVEHDDAGGPDRQGLLVEGSGDPTLSAADLEQAATALRAQGMRRLDAGIFLDGTLFDDQIFPAAWGDVSNAEPWFAPVSPFIVDANVVNFHISYRPDGLGFEIFSATPGVSLVSTIRELQGNERPVVHVEQSWHKNRGTFAISGALDPPGSPYTLSIAVERPRTHFYQQLLHALRRAHIRGAIPLRSDPLPEGERRWLHTQTSAPLREVLVDVNKHSSNLTAEVLLRTMALRDKQAGITSQDGLDVLRQVMTDMFPNTPENLTLADGSGLSRDNRATAAYLVQLLRRVYDDFSVRPEFLNSLSLAGLDGTLEFRDYVAPLKGRLRAKSGTLNGVSSLSGYLELPQDVVIFSFLVNQPGQRIIDLQRGQDRFMRGLYEELSEFAPRVAQRQ